MQGLGLGGEAFGKGLAAKREQEQADIQPEREAAMQTWGGGRGVLRGGWEQAHRAQPGPGAWPHRSLTPVGH